MIANLRKMRNKISNLKLNERSIDFIILYILIYSCQGSKYNISKYMLAQKELLMLYLVIKRLRSIE